jgi:pimeloyl-ACP methyl ester carboxylesterase
MDSRHRREAGVTGAPAPAAAVLALTAAFCLACGSNPAALASPAPSAPPASAYCLTPGDRARAVRFEGINGQLAGSGQVGLVLTNGVSDTPCVWSVVLPSLLSTNRYLVLLYFYRRDIEKDIEEDIANAETFMLKQGVSRVILVGNSLGGAGTLAAAASPIQPPPAAAVSFSGESSPEDVRSLQVPTLIFASEDDHYFPGKTARQVLAAIPAEDKSLRVYPGLLHGVDILTGPDGPQALRVFNDFLARH